MKRSSLSHAARYFLFIPLGVVVLFWITAALPELRRAVSQKGISANILAGQAYPLEELDLQILRTADPDPVIDYARMSNIRAVVQLRALEMALDSANPMGLDARMAKLSTTLHQAVHLNPADALTWVVLFWLESLRNGPSARFLSYLALSYDLGPFEGNVSLRRNRLALASFSELAKATQANAVAEFSSMLDAQFMDVVFANLIGPGWPHRELLLSTLGDVDRTAKQDLVKMFGVEGLRLKIPGTSEKEDRPWRR